jgi:hypothetical protein
MIAVPQQNDILTINPVRTLFCMACLFIAHNCQTILILLYAVSHSPHPASHAPHVLTQQSEPQLLDCMLFDTCVVCYSDLTGPGWSRSPCCCRLRYPRMCISRLGYRAVLTMDRCVTCRTFDIIAPSYRCQSRYDARVT